MSKFKPGDIVYVVCSPSEIKKATVIKYNGFLYTIRFGLGSRMNIKENRLCSSEAEAKAASLKRAIK